MSEPVESAPPGLLLSDDLIFASRIAGTARAAGLEVRQVRAADALPELARQLQARCVIVDLAFPGLDLPALMQRLGSTARVVAYGPHVDADSLKAARAAGCAVVLPRSKFVEELPQLWLPQWLKGAAAGGERPLIARRLAVRPHRGYHVVIPVSHAVRYTVIWTTMVLTAALAAAPEDKDKLAITNVRDTHGLMGPTRTVDKLTPGGELYLSFDIDGMTIDDDGKVHYSIATEVTDAAGKAIIKIDPHELDAPASLGGDRIPAFVHLDIGLQSPPGQYTVKATVVDLPSKRSATVTRTVDVQAKDFAIVRLKTTSDQEGQLPVAVPGAGEGLWITFGAVGFGRGGDGKQPDLTFEMRVLDENGKPTRTKPFSLQVNKDVPADAALVPAQFFLSLNRSGKFTIELTASDKVGKKTAHLTFPLTIHDPK